MIPPYKALTFSELDLSFGIWLGFPLYFCSVLIGFYVVLETVTTEQADEEYKFAFKTDDEAAGLVEAIQVWPSPPFYNMHD